MKTRNAPENKAQKSMKASSGPQNLDLILSCELCLGWVQYQKPGLVGNHAQASSGVKSDIVKEME